MSEYVAKLIIIGSGPAGYSAGIYAARAGLEPIMISGFEVGGQLTMTASVENFPGFVEAVSGTDLMEKMRTQALSFGLQIINDKVTEVDLSARPFVLSTENGNCCKTQSLIIVGQVHGELEYELAQFYQKQKNKKPMWLYVPGRSLDRSDKRPFLGMKTVKFSDVIDAKKEAALAAGIQWIESVDAFAKIVKKGKK